MINSKDVVRMYVPFPDISSDLAVSKHMYVCRNHIASDYEYVKCQTYKPALISESVIKHGVLEYPNYNRNPFKHLTIIDCDKLFCSHSVRYGKELLTITRPDVSQTVFDNIIRELDKDGYTTIPMDEDSLCRINDYIYR